MRFDHSRLSRSTFWELLRVHPLSLHVHPPQIRFSCLAFAEGARVHNKKNLSFIAITPAPSIERRIGQLVNIASAQFTYSSRNY